MTPAMSQNRWSLRKQIFDYICNQIEKGTLVPGDSINVKQLTQDLNVSRTPLREALAQLEIQGLVTILPQRGVTINVLTYQELLNIFEILGALESQALKSVFNLLTSKDIDSMEKHNHDMAQATRRKRNRIFHEKNIQLHAIFLDLSSNEELKHTVSNLKLRLFGFAMKSYRTAFKEAIVQEHDTLIELIRAGKNTQAFTFLKDVHWKFNYPENFIRPDSIKNHMP